MPALPDRCLLLTLSGDIHLKSARTRRRFLRILRQNIRVALEATPGAELTGGPAGRMAITVDEADVDAAAAAAARVFGVYRVEQVARVPAGDLDQLVEAVASAARAEVTGRRFAVRVRRRGEHSWRSIDAERAIGSALLDGSGGVDLTHPEVTVRVEVWDGDAFVTERRWPGADGLPLGTQPPVLSLLSGGFDSPVAAWLLMRRGCPVDLVHFTMDCAQSEHALAVGYEVWRRWGAGTEPRAWVIEFREIKEALLDHVDSAHRQVVLKQLMFAAAAGLARREHHPVLVTGESVGQVSSQTITNLAEIDRAHDASVLRPLAGLTKEEIMGYARRIGTYDLSARAKEVCDLATGPVATAARRSDLRRANAALPADLVARALDARRVVSLPHWEPGIDPIPVVSELLDGVPVVHEGEEAPASGPVAFAGRDAVARATEQAGRGRRTWIAVGDAGREPRLPPVPA